MIIISYFLKVIHPFVGLERHKKRMIEILTLDLEIMKFLVKLLRVLKYIFILFIFSLDLPNLKEAFILKNKILGLDNINLIII
jgi:hypothetical protein